jgi:uncharacterized membrane protein
MKGLTSVLSHHGRFFIAILCGVAAYAVATVMGVDAPELAGGDAFYIGFLAFSVLLIARQKPSDLKRRAKSEDEGIAVVLLITLTTIGFFCVAVFTALNKKNGIDLAPVVMAGIGAPLGWFTLHTVMAFHYANVHYFEDPDGAGDDKGLDFPGRAQPGPWDFLYYSFVVGMTAQVSDVQVRTSAMRRLTLFHSVVSFFFNTVFIAMAVNAGVALAA